MRMSSTHARAKWLESHRDVVREIHPDQGDMKAKLRLAERNLERARSNAEGDPDLALVAAESALVNIADAVLATEGLRLRGKTGSHEARFSYPALPRGKAGYENRASCEPVFPRRRSPSVARTASAMLTRADSAATSAR